MYDYIKGIVTNIVSNAIILDNNGIGYLIYTPNPYSFHEGNEYKVFVFQNVKEDELSLYGFKSIEEKELFLKLISVKGLGPKMTLPILATGSVAGVVDAIERENILYLKKFPKIGDKVAKQIILDLKGKLGVIATGEVVDTNSYEELIEVLKGLGYKEKEFKSVSSSDLGIENNDAELKEEENDVNLSIENQVKEALKLLLK